MTPHLPPPPLPGVQPDHHPADPDGKVKECMYTCVRLYHAASAQYTLEGEPLTRNDAISSVMAAIFIVYVKPGLTIRHQDVHIFAIQLFAALIIL